MRAELASPSVSSVPASRMVGRYLMYDQIASGGMASVHFGRLFGAVGFSRTVAIKRLHAHYLGDDEFVSMFVDEARLAARIQHPNVAAPLDVVLEDNGEIFLVMEYIHGDTLARLLSSARNTKQVIPPAVSVSILNGALHGLHAAHEAVDETGQPLGIVHRDISPQNIMVATDGAARVLDFGIAKAVSRCQSTRQGLLKGKLPYMAPEQMRCEPVDRRVDIFAAGIVLWETLTQKRLFDPDDAAAAFSLIVSAPIVPPSTVNRDVPAALDKVVMKALERRVDMRFQTALEFADALEEAIPPAPQRKVGGWVERLCSAHLSQRAGKVSTIERATFDPNASTDAQSLLRSSRLTAPRTTVSSTVSRTGETVAGPLRSQVTETTNSHATIPPSTLMSQPLAHDVRGQRRLWPLLSVIVLALCAAGFYQLHLMDDSSKGRPGFTSGATVQPTQGSQPPPPAPQVPAPAPPQHTLPAGTQPSAQTGEQPRLPKASNQKTGAPRHTAKAKRGKLSQSNKPLPKKDCDPPFYIDARGIRRVKPHCI